jgi:hypothetical protein
MEFLVIDAAQNTSEPAFDHARLARTLSLAAKQEYKATKLPFDSFEYADGGKAITFHIEDVAWTCKLANYECERSPDHKKHEAYEEPSPNGQWAAFVKDHNLYLRYVSTGQVTQLTRDGEAGWSYATELPSLGLMVEQGTENVKQHAAVFWSPDSSKLVSFGYLLRRVEGLDVRILHLVRDPRGVAFSWQRERARDDRGGGSGSMARESPVRSAVLWDTWNFTAERLWERIEEVRAWNKGKKGFRLLAGSEIPIACRSPTLRFVSPGQIR